MLHDSLKEALRVALKGGDTEAVGIVRLLLAQLHGRAIEKSGALRDGVVLDDKEVIAVFQKEAKKRREAIVLYEKGNREDLAKKERQELAFIMRYLPLPASEEEIERLVLGLIEGGGREFASVMKEAMRQLGERGDGRLVSSVVKKKLGG